MIAFSINKDQADTFLKEMMQAAAHLNRDIFSQFLESHQNEINRDLFMKLAKSTQKVGNCGIANSNISWHFQLASNYMLEHKTNFATAYEKTKPEYKKRLSP